MQNNITLTDAEWKIMNALWEAAPQTITQLVATLRASTGWAKSTVITLLGRMVDKQAIHYREGERARLYFPAVSREEMAPTETACFLQRMYGGSLSLMINTMVESNGLTSQELQELKSILERAEKDND